MKHRQDATGKLAKMAKKIIKAEPEYRDLKRIKILYVWREGKPKRDPDGGYVAAEASVLSNRMRDLWGYDAQIEVSEDVWLALSMSWKNRLLWHELRHLHVEMMEDEDSGKLVPDRDKEDRIVVSTVPHDISLRTFKAEIERFGIDTEEIGMMKFISKMYRRSKKGKVKKYARPKALLDDEEESEGE